MEIREPKFKCGDKVINLEDGNAYTVESINDYKFMQDEYWYNLYEYWYNLSEHLCIFPESALELYANKSKTVWDLKIGDKCYFATVIGHVFPGTWNNLNAQIENRKLGNCFLTEEEAEYELERRRIENEMLRLGGRRNFKKGELNWYIYSFCDFGNKNSIGYNYDRDNNDGRWRIYFDSIKDCSNAVNLIGEDKIKKYLFGVEE